MLYNIIYDMQKGMSRMYGTDDQIYCYPNTNILVNKFNIKDSIKLDELEREISEFKIIILESAIMENKLDNFNIISKIDDNFLKEVHRFVFEDVYEWAGSYRKVRIIKGNTTFCYPENIESELIKIFESLQKDNYLIGLNKEQLIDKISYYIAELNVIHPFREGNGRVLRILSNTISLKSNFYINYSKISKEEYLNAMIKSITDTSLLKSLITRSLEHKSD